MRTSPLRSPAYLAFVRAHPCCICGGCEDIHAHHHGRREGGGGMGVKTCDLHTVPLCASCHQNWHQRGTFDHPSCMLPVKKRGGRERVGLGPHHFHSREKAELQLWKAVAVLLREAHLKGLLSNVEAMAG